jgi:hypothetical protein
LECPPRLDIETVIYRRGKDYIWLGLSSQKMKSRTTLIGVSRDGGRLSIIKKGAG